VPEPLAPGPGIPDNPPGEPDDNGAPLRLSREPVALPLREPWTIARGTSAARTNVIVRLWEGEGAPAGLGEAAPNQRYGEDWRSVIAALDRLEPMVAAGRGDWSGLLDRLTLLEPEHPSARAALDIALHDVEARRRGVPLHSLLGADPARMPDTSYSVGLDAVPVMQEKAKQAEAFPFLKIKLDGRDDRAVVEGIRAVTGRPLLVDANEAWTDADEAIEKTRWMRDLGVILVEQPLPAADLDGARRLRARSALPIYADEAVRVVDDLPALAEAYDGVNVKVQKSGGLRPALRIIEAARGLGLEVLIGCMIETSVGITASAHLAPLADRADLDGALLLASDPFRGASIEAGVITLPDVPGLGAVERR